MWKSPQTPPTITYGITYGRLFLNEYHIIQYEILCFLVIEYFYEKNFGLIFIFLSTFFGSLSPILYVKSHLNFDQENWLAPTSPVQGDSLINRCLVLCFRY